MAKCKTSYAPREVLEGKLLAALDDESKVAIVLDKADVDMLINALEAYPAHAVKGGKSHRQYAADLRQLRSAAFGE